MKKILIYILPLIAILVGGCKTEDKWMDWKAENEAWLAQNATKENVHVTESGLQYKILSYGNQTDAKPDNNSIVICSYIGTLINGYVFDQAVNSELYMGQLTEGFQEGLKLIHAHGDIEIYAPYDLMYKDNEQGTEGSLSASYIPPYSTLIFRIHLTNVSK